MDKCLVLFVILFSVCRVKEVLQYLLFVSFYFEMMVQESLLCGFCGSQCHVQHLTSNVII